MKQINHLCLSSPAAAYPLSCHRQSQMSLHVKKGSKKVKKKKILKNLTIYKVKADIATKNKNHDDDGRIDGVKRWMKLMKGILPFPDDGNCRLFRGRQKKTIFFQHAL